MEQKKNYYIADMYLIPFHIFTLIAVYFWQDYDPYITEYKEMTILADLFICFIFAVLSALLAWIGLNRISVQDKNNPPIFQKFVLGNVYGLLSTFTLAILAETARLHTQETLRIGLTALLFLGTVYFSILRYASLKTIDFIGIIVLISLVLGYFLLLLIG